MKLSFVRLTEDLHLPCLFYFASLFVESAFTCEEIDQRLDGIRVGALSCCIFNSSSNQSMQSLKQVGLEPSVAERIKDATVFANLVFMLVSETS